MRLAKSKRGASLLARQRGELQDAGADRVPFVLAIVACGRDVRSPTRKRIARVFTGSDFGTGEGSPTPRQPAAQPQRRPGVS